jgi:hypothetical protein
MDLSLSERAATYAALQGLPKVCYDSEIYYRVQKSAQHVPILIQTYPIRTNKS